MCKSAPQSRQITTLALTSQFFTGHIAKLCATRKLVASSVYAPMHYSPENGTCPRSDIWWAGNV